MIEAKATEGPSREPTIREGELVYLSLSDGKSFLLRMQRDTVFSTHQGTVAHNHMIGATWGAAVLSSSNKILYALRPRGVDHMMKLRRETNIMYPKDVFYLLAEMDLRPGDRVVELGSGSGSMTQALARAVSPGGLVFSYDLRPEFSELAQMNCRRAGISNVEFRLREAEQAIEPDVDAVFTDVPEPWRELSAIRAALRGSGRYAAGLPTYNQAEKLAVALERHGFGRIECVELLHRRILTREGKTRPEQRMVAHTMLLLSAVKLGAASEPDEG